MKKHLLALGISLCTALSYAQTLIPKIGGTLSTIAYDKDQIADGQSFYNKPAFLFGLAIEFPLNDLISIQPELLFQQKGTRYKYEEPSFAKVEEKITLNYLELPVLVKFNFNKFYVNAGPSVSYGIGGKVKTKSTDQGVITTSSFKIKFGEDPDNTLDLGLQVGGGFKVARFMIIDLRYGMGLLNLYDKDEDAGFTKNKSKNRSLQLSLGFPINLGSK